MPSEEYWDGDCTLARAYKEAYELRLEQMNFQVWLQGRYVYEAVLGAAPILHAFAKKNAKPIPYPGKPYPITPGAKKVEEAEEEKRQMDKIKAKVMSFMGQHNARLGVKKADAD